MSDPGEPRGHSGGFTAIALAPGFKPDRKGERDAADDRMPLMRPAVTTPNGFPDRQSLDEYRAVILADVPSLAPAAADALAGYVIAGGSLLITPGPNVLPEFYNDWHSTNGAFMTPLRMETRIAATGGKRGFALLVESLGLPLLSTLADHGQSDLAQLCLSGCWKLSAREDREATVLAELEGGLPFLAMQRVGHGAVMMTAAAFRAGEGNLVKLHAFVPLVHGLIQALDHSSSLDLNHAASAAADFHLARVPAAGSFESAQGFLLDPRGEESEIDIRAEKGALAVTIDPMIVAGVYKLRFPASLAQQLWGLRSPDGTIPFVVQPDETESVLAPLDDTDIGMLAKRLELIAADSGKAVIHALSGKKFGEEIWRTFAAAVFLLLLTELMLTRWIALRRQTGTTEAVVFEKV